VKRYSDFLKTLYDQPEPVGEIGGGCHYSVLRAPVWRAGALGDGEVATFHDFAVIWDEDHDERIVKVIEDLYLGGLLPRVLFVGERKGLLSVVLDPKAASEMEKLGTLHDYRERLEQGFEAPPPDLWELTSFGILGSEPGSIIADEKERVVRYLDSINLLWRLGRKEAKFGRSGNAPVR